MLVPNGAYLFKRDDEWGVYLYTNSVVIFLFYSGHQYYAMINVRYDVMRGRIVYTQDETYQTDKIPTDKAALLARDILVGDCLRRDYAAERITAGEHFNALFPHLKIDEFDVASGAGGIACA